MTHDIFRSKKTTLGLIFFGVLFMCFALQSSKAFAIVNLNPDPGAGIPAFPYNYFRTCDSGNQSPAFQQWVTSPSSPGSTTVVIDEGTTVVPLQYTFAGVVCKSNSAVTNTRAVIINATPAGVGGVNGTILDLNFGAGFRTVGTYRSSTINFTYSSATPITSDFTIQLNTKIINRFTNNNFLCVPGPAGNKGSLAGYGACQTNSFAFTVHVVVKKKPINVACSVVPVTIQLGASYLPKVSLTHGGPAAAPSVSVSGTLTAQGFAAENISGTIPNDGTARILAATTARTFGAAGTYTVTAALTGTAAGYVVNDIGCDGIVTVVLPPPVVRCDSQNKQALSGDPVAVDFTIYHDGPANAPAVSFGATLAIDTKPNQSFSGSLNRFTNSTRTGTSYVLAPGVYNYTVSVSTAPSVAVVPCRGTITILIGPYVRTYGNDVQTGGGFTTATGLCATQSGQINTQNRGSAGGYAGSGSQLGAFARGSITGFRSASMRSDAGSAPTALSFADTLTGALGFGGTYGANLCMVDQWSQGQAGQPVTTQSIDIATFGDGVTTSYLITPTNAGLPVTISGLIPNGRRLALYIKGNAVIVPNAAGRFGYASTNWPTLNDVPSLYVVVLGNIGIASTATNIDGNYIAQPAVVGTGRITTCVNPATGAIYDSAGLIANCGRQLIVNGSFSATHVNFLRTINTVSQATPSEPALASKAAEVLRYGIEAIVSRQAIPAKPTQTYDSITALPPSL